MNPFKLPNVEHIGHSSPLNPYLYEYHSDYYAPVDNTLRAFEVYADLLRAFDGIPKRHAIMVHGESGCGKSSLIYRCIKLVVSTEWKSKKTKLYILDFHRENVAGFSASDKVEQMLNLVSLSLQENPITDALAAKFEDKVQHQKNIALPFLENELKRLEVIPAIFFPGIETEKELADYLSIFYRSNWFLFFETTNQSVVSKCETNYRMSSTYPIQLLKVNPLQARDANSFLSTRFALIKDSPKGKIKFEDRALEVYLESAASGTRGGASLRELEIICSKVFDLAVQDNQQIISFSDMAKVAIAMFTGS